MRMRWTLAFCLAALALYGQEGGPKGLYIRGEIRHGNGQSFIDYENHKMILYVRPPQPGSLQIMPPTPSQNWTPTMPRVPFAAGQSAFPTTPQYNQMLSTLRSNRDALIRQNFSLSSLNQSLQKLPEEARRFAYAEAEWLGELNTRLVTSGSPPLIDAFPQLAAGLRDLDAFAMQRGLEQFNQALLSKSNQTSALAQSLEGYIVDRQGLLANLPDTPTPIQLITPWASQSGVRVRNSLNKLMVTQQTVSDLTHLGCTSSAEDVCAGLKTREREFSEQYAELSLLHGVADRLALASDPAFVPLMAALEETTDFLYGFVSGVATVGKETVEFFTSPVVNGKKVIAGLNFAFENTAAVRAALSKVLDETWDELQSGTSERRGEIIGKATGEILLALIPSTGLAKMGKFKAIEGLAKVASLGTNIAEKVEFLAKSRTFHLLAEATERTLDGMAASRKIRAFEATGRLTKEMAKEALALSKIFPRASAKIVENRALAGALEGFSEMLAKTRRPGALLQSAETDLHFMELVAKEGAAALEFAKDYGIESAAGLARLNSVASGTLSAWAAQGTLKELAAASRQLARAVSDMPPSALGSLRNFGEAVKELAARNIPLSDNAVEFMAYQAVNSERILKNTSEKTFSSEAFRTMATSYHRLEQEIPKIAGEAFEGKVWRGIASESKDVAGNPVLRGADDAYKLGPWNKVESHRFSAPGEMATYVSTESEAVAKQVIRGELPRVPMEKILFQSRDIKLQKVLNLTQYTGLVGSEIRSSAYELTQQVGHIARRFGFDGISYKPAEVAKELGMVKPNLVIFAP